MIYDSIWSYVDICNYIYIYIWTHSTWIWFECFFSCFGLMTLDQKWLRVAKLTLLDTGSSRETHQVCQLAVGGPSNDKMTRQQGTSIVRRVRPKMREVVYANAISLARHENMHDRSARKFYTISMSWFQPTALLHTHIIQWSGKLNVQVTKTPRLLAIALL